MTAGGSSSLVGLPGLARPTLAGDDDVADTEVVQVVVDVLFAVAAAGGHSAWLPSSPADNPFDRWFQSGRVRGLPGDDLLTRPSTWAVAIRSVGPPVTSNVTRNGVS